MPNVWLPIIAFALILNVITYAALVWLAWRMSRAVTPPG